MVRDGVNKAYRKIGNITTTIPPENMPVELFARKARGLILLAWCWLQYLILCLKAVAYI